MSEAKMPISGYYINCKKHGKQDVVLIAFKGRFRNRVLCKKCYKIKKNEN